MKSTIARSRSKKFDLIYSDLKVGNLYNYTVNKSAAPGTKGVVLCVRNIDNGERRLVEVNPDIYTCTLWGSPSDINPFPSHRFSLFTDKITLSNE